MDMLRAVLLAYIIWCPALGQTYKISVIVGGQPENILATNVTLASIMIPK